MMFLWQFFFSAFAIEVRAAETIKSMKMYEHTKSAVALSILNPSDLHKKISTTMTTDHRPLQYHRI